MKRLVSISIIGLSLALLIGAGLMAATPRQAEAAGPPTPTGLWASAMTSGDVRVSWDESVDATSGYSIQRRVDPSTTWVNWYRTPTAEGSKVTGWNDTRVAPGKKYYYRIRAHSGTTFSGWSAEVSATTPAAQQLKYSSGIGRILAAGKGIYLTEMQGYPSGSVYPNAFIGTLCISSGSDPGYDIDLSELCRPSVVSWTRYVTSGAAGATYQLAGNGARLWNHTAGPLTITYTFAYWRSD